MNATVIDTLRFADRLKAAGFEAPHAEGMARALGDELAERMLTKSDLDEALRPIYARFDAIDARFVGIDGKFDAIDKKFDAIDARFEAIDKKFDAIDARFDAMDTKIDSLYRELSGKFNILVGVMALGFTLLVGLGGYNAVSPRFAQPIMQVTQTPQEATELPAMPAPRALTKD